MNPFRPERRRQRGRQYAAGEHDYRVAAESLLATVTNNSDRASSPAGARDGTGRMKERSPNLYGRGLPIRRRLRQYSPAARILAAIDLWVIDTRSRSVLQRIMPRWPDKIAEAVMFDVGIALNFKVGRTLRPLTDLERKVVAKIIFDHLQPSNSVIERGPPGANTSPENWPKRPE
jgi:hypothetical protein